MHLQYVYPDILSVKITLLTCASLTWMLLCSSRQSFFSPVNFTAASAGYFLHIIEVLESSDESSQVCRRVYCNSCHCCAVAPCEHQGAVWRRHSEHTSVLSTGRQAVITHFKLGAHVTALSEHQSATLLSSQRSQPQTDRQWSGGSILFLLLSDILLVLNRTEATSVHRSRVLFLDTAECCLGNWVATF